MLKFFQLEMQDLVHLHKHIWAMFTSFNEVKENLSITGTDVLAYLEDYNKTQDWILHLNQFLIDWILLDSSLI